MNNPIQPRKNSISFFRILNTYLIITFHLENDLKFFASYGIRLGWYFSNFFFFIVSGYLLYSGYIKNPDRYKTGAAYTFSRFKKIYPYMLISYIPIFIFRLFRDGFKDTMYFFLSGFWEFVCLQGIGCNHGWIWFNNSFWYLSVMLVCGFIIYHCIAKWHDTFVNFVCPLMLMVLFSYLFRERGNLSSTLEVRGFYGNFLLIMGFCAMSFGIYAYKLTSAVMSKVKNTLPLRILGLIILILIPIFTLFKGYTDKDFLYLFLDAIGIALCFIPWDCKFFASKVIQGWADLTLYIYLAHMFFAYYIFPLFAPLASDFLSNIVIILGCAVSATIGGILLKALTNLLIRALNSKKSIQS